MADFDKSSNRINVMCGEEIIIDKLYGETIFADLKIRAVFTGLEAYWLIERMNIKTGEFEEPIKIDAQRDNEFDKEDEG